MSFDPSKPFEEVKSTFDPNKPFEKVKEYTSTLSSEPTKTATSSSIGPWEAGARGAGQSFYSLGDEAEAAAKTLPSIAQTYMKGELPSTSQVGETYRAEREKLSLIHI